MLFHIIYPNNAYLTEYQINMRFADAVANGDIDSSETLGEVSLGGKAILLDNAGLITLHKDWKGPNYCEDCGQLHHNCLCGHID